MADRGYGSVLVLALLLGVVLLMGTVVDIVRLVHEWRRVEQVATVAAETGAGWVEPDLLYDSVIIIDEPAATDAALGVVRAAGLSADIDTSGEEVCVAVASTVHPVLGRLLGHGAESVEVIACASPRQG